MKRCSLCNQTYGDEMSFCLADGTPLGIMIDNAEQPTVVRPSPATPAAATASSESSNLKYFVAVGAVLLVFGFLAIAAAALILWPRGTGVTNTATANNANRSSAMPSPSPNRTVEVATTNTNRDIGDAEKELERERRKLADERKKLDDDKRRQAEEDESDDDEPEPPTFNDPVTTRLSFRRGSTGTTVSGTVGKRRRYVLRAMAGQYLAGSVSGPGNCVAFEGGSSSVGFATGQGDNDFVVVNKCSRPSNFSLTVTVR